MWYSVLNEGKIIISCPRSGGNLQKSRFIYLFIQIIEHIYWNIFYVISSISVLTIAHAYCCKYRNNKYLLWSKRRKLNRAFPPMGIKLIQQSTRCECESLQQIDLFLYLSHFKIKFKTCYWKRDGLRIKGLFTKILHFLPILNKFKYLSVFKVIN